MFSVAPSTLQSKLKALLPLWSEIGNNSWLRDQIAMRLKSSLSQENSQYNTSLWRGELRISWRIHPRWAVRISWRTHHYWSSQYSPTDSRKALGVSRRGLHILCGPRVKIRKCDSKGSCRKSYASIRLLLHAVQSLSNDEVGVTSERGEFEISLYLLSCGSIGFYFLSSSSCTGQDL